MSSFPSSFNLAAGIEGLSSIVTPLIAEPVFNVVGIPDMQQLAMVPEVGDLSVQRDAESGPEGFLAFQFTQYFAKMAHWKKRTPRVAQKGGFGGTIRIDIRNVQSTEELTANELWPFANSNVTGFQQKEMMVTANRVISNFQDARVRDRPDSILGPLVANSLVVWDGLPLIDQNHTHPDKVLFSNQLIAGLPIVHMTDMIVPVRVDPLNPTVEEIYTELSFAMLYFSLIRMHLTRFQKVQQAWDIEVIIKDPVTLLAMQELNRIKQAKFLAEAESDLNLNPFFEAINITYDRTVHTDVNEKMEYFVIPRTDAFEREPGQEPVSPIPGLVPWRPVPRPLVFALVREATVIDHNYNEWRDPVFAELGIWESWGISAGFAEEVLRIDPNPA